MARPSGKGYEILSIGTEKKEVLLVFKNATLHLTSALYSEGFYYPGKVLSPDEYKTLKERIAYAKAEKRLEHFLLTKRRTVGECKAHLAKSGVPKERMEAMLSPFVRDGNLDDESYAMDYLEDALSARIGPKRALSNLRKKGIGEDVLETAAFQERLETLAVPDERTVEALFRKCATKVGKARKAAVLSALLQRGYGREKAAEAIERFSAFQTEEEGAKEEEAKKRLLGLEGQRCYNAIAKRRDDSRKKKEAFFRKMLRLGFAYGEIQGWLEEKGYEFQ